MTCIVGLVDNKIVYLGGDSAGVAADFTRTLRRDHKVFKKANMVFGFTTSFRMGQLLQYNLVIPRHHSNVSDFAYLCSVFSDALIKCFTEKNYAEVKDNQIVGGTFLVGYRGKLYKIYSDFQVAHSVESYNSCGSGDLQALGALRALEPYKLSAVERIKRALATAAHFSAAVAPPFRIVKTSTMERNQ